MKTIRIYERFVSERTGFRKFPFKTAHQITVEYDGIFYSNHSERIDNPCLKIKFEKVFETRKTSELKNFVENLGHTNADKWLKETLKLIIKEI